MNVYVTLFWKVDLVSQNKYCWWTCLLSLDDSWAQSPWSPCPLLLPQVMQAQDLLNLRCPINSVTFTRRGGFHHECVPCIWWIQLDQALPCQISVFISVRERISSRRIDPILSLLYAQLPGSFIPVEYVAAQTFLNMLFFRAILEVVDLRCITVGWTKDGNEFLVSPMHTSDRAMIKKQRLTVVHDEMCSPLEYHLCPFLD